MTAKHLPAPGHSAVAAALAVAVVALLTCGTARAGTTGADMFALATDITAALPITITGDNNSAATAESGEPAHWTAAAHSLWYMWQAPADGRLQVSTMGSNFDTVLAVYTKIVPASPVPPFTNLNLEANNDEFGGTSQSQVTIQVTLNTVYYIAVDGWNGNTGNIKLTLSVPPLPPTNDNFASANDLNALTTPPGTLPINANGTNRNATAEPGEGDHGTGSGVASASVWWKWTPSANVAVTIAAGGDFPRVLAVYTQAGAVPPFTNLTLEASNGSDPAQVTFRAVAATTYYIAVDGWGGMTGSINLNLHAAHPPVNDDLANATVINGALPVAVTGTNVEAMHETDEPPHLDNLGAPDAGSGSVWWSWTAQSSGRVVVTTDGSSFDPLLTIYTGSDYASLTEVAYGMDWPLRASFQAQAGTTYKIAVDGWSRSWRNTGVVYLQIFNPPANDDFANATAISGTPTAQKPVTVTGVNTFASKEAYGADVEPNHAGMPGGSSVWWYWDATFNGQVAVSTQGSDFNTLLAVYSKNPPAAAVPPFSNLALAAQNDNANNFTATSLVSFAATQGVRYYIAVDSDPFNTGLILLSLGIPPANDNAGTPTLLSGALPIAATGNNAFASKENLEPDYVGIAGGTSVWWTWQSPASGGTYTISTEGSSFDTLLAVYTASGAVPPFGNLTLVPNGDNDDVGYSTTSRVSFTDLGATLYYIVVDGKNGESGAINLSIGGPPTNDNLLNATDLGSTFPTSTTGSNKFATREPSEPYHAFTQGDTSVWWKWKAPADGKVTVTTAGSDFDTLLAVYTGADYATLGSAIASNDDMGGLNTSQATFFAVKDTVYNIAVDGNNGESGAIKLALVSPPANDDYAKATVLSSALPVSTTGANQYGSVENSEPQFFNPMMAGLGGSSVWWSWTAPSSGKITVSTGNSDLDTLLAVYTGGRVDQSTEVASNDDYNGRLTSQLTFQATENITYRIGVDGYDGTSGNITLTLRAAAGPVNDDFANAIALTGTLPIKVTGNNLDASKEPLEPNHAGKKGGTSVWWTWTAPSTFNGPVTVSTAGSDFSTLSAAYVGSPIVAMTEVGSSGSGQFTFSALANTTYSIAVDGANGAAGNIVLTLATPPINDNFASAESLNTAAYNNGALTQPIVVTTTSDGKTASNTGATAESTRVWQPMPMPGGWVDQRIEPATHAGNAGGASVWWKWTPTASGPVTISTIGSDFDTLLAVYLGDDVSLLWQVQNGANDNFNADVPASQLTIQAQAQTTYYIVVDGHNGGKGAVTGTIKLTIRNFALPNLVVQSITPPSTAPEASKSATFTVRVQNTSTADAGDFAVAFFGHSAQAPDISAAADQIQYISFLEGGGYKDVPFTASKDTVGAYTAWAYADYGKDVAESDETDNAGPANGQAWTVVQEIPSVMGLSSDAGVVGTAFAASIVVNNPVSSPTGFAITGLPATEELGLSFDAATGNISGTPLKAGSYIVSLTATNAGGTSDPKSAKITITLSPPLITSALTGSGVEGTVFNLPLTADGTQPIVFTADSLPPGLAISGDSTAGYSISGTPTQPGEYHVLLTATNSAGNTDKQTLILIIGSTDDTDGDGFSNAMETAMGSDPNVYASTPINNAKAPAAQGLGITSFKLKLDTSATGKDSISLSGFFEPPAGVTSAASQTIVVDLGGIARVFILDAKGASPKTNKNESLKAAIKSGRVNFSEKLSKGTYSKTLAGGALAGNQGDAKKIQTVTITILMGGGLYQKDQFVQYTAKAGKTSASGIGTEGKTSALPSRQ